MGLGVKCDVPDTKRSNRAVNPGLTATHGYFSHRAGKAAATYKPVHRVISPK
jgi:hypothetical protein